MDKEDILFENYRLLAEVIMRDVNNPKNQGESVVDVMAFVFTKSMLIKQLNRSILDLVTSHYDDEGKAYNVHGNLTFSQFLEAGGGECPICLTQKVKELEAKLREAEQKLMFFTVGAVRTSGIS